MFRRSLNLAKKSPIFTVSKENKIKIHSQQFSSFFRLPYLYTKIYDRGKFRASTIHIFFFFWQLFLGYTMEKKLLSRNGYNNSYKKFVNVFRYTQSINSKIQVQLHCYNNINLSIFQEVSIEYFLRVLDIYTYK